MADSGCESKAESLEGRFQSLQKVYPKKEGIQDD